MLAIMGPQYAHRPGMQVRTTLDLDLQLQADCALRTHFARLGGDSSPQVQSASDGSECVAGLGLPPLRPSDVGLDHRVSDIASVILDPFRGEVLSLVDTRAMLSSQSAPLFLSNTDRDLGSAFYPFIYLAAFSRGFAPGTMIMDLPPELDGAAVEAIGQASYDWADFHGPVSMRTALVGAYQAAAVRTIELAGEGNVLRTGQQMGVIGMNDPEAYDPIALSQGEATASLLDMIYGYAVIANNGTMIGVDLSSIDADIASQNPAPIAITLIEDAGGNEIYAMQPDVRAVLSPQLAYLMADVLSDEVARWDTLGQSNPLELGRPAGAMVGMTSSTNDNWTLGFTPTRAVGVWIGNTTDENMVGIGPLNGAAPLWHALMEYATTDLPAQGWSMPPGISEMEVCDPSGLLPTQYCPHVVREIYIHGTEPTSYDTLYQPFRINRDTGKLATLFTPLDLVEECVFMVLPPEAEAWAQYMGIEQPPQEYDSIYVQPGFDPEVNITSLEPFSYVRGVLSLEGNARPEDFLYYRLKYGEGINPTRWVQIGVDLDEPVWDGVLGEWDTSSLNGLYTLQLVVIREGDRVETAAVPVTIDNLAPDVQWIAPEQGQQYRLGLVDEVIIQVEVVDETGVARVMIYVDERRIETLENPPFTTTWRIAGMGEHRISVRAYDLAGNLAQIDGLTIEVIP
jgi:membrane carboxypeptidase/penicillin-binding protein PbpC